MAKGQLTKQQAKGMIVNLTDQQKIILYLTLKDLLHIQSRAAIDSLKEKIAD